MRLRPPTWNRVVRLGYEWLSWRDDRSRLRTVAVRSKRILSWHDNLTHLLGLVSTCLVILLSLRNEIFANADDPDLSSKLNAMQFAAALHAALLTMSLSLTAVAQTCYQMTLEQGIPFGLVTAAYHLSSPEQLFSRALWSFKWSWPDVKDLWLPCLRVAVGGVVLLTALLGPSSAVLLVPQVGYVDCDRPLVNGDVPKALAPSRPSFMTADYDAIFPSEIDASWAPDDCDPSMLTFLPDCPNAFMEGIAIWCSMWVTIQAHPNITVPALSVTPIIRPLIASNPTLLYEGWSAATVQMLNLSRLIKSLWSWSQRSGNRLSTAATNPRIELTFDKERPVLQPFVQVQCSKPTFLWDQAEITVSFEYDRLVSPVALSETSRTPVNITLNTSDWNTRQAAQAEFVDLELPPHKSALGAIIGLSFTGLEFDNSSGAERAVIPCIIDARWVPSTLIYQPSVSNTVLSNISDPGTLDHAVYISGKPIHIDVSYANTLNSQLSGYTLNNLSYTVLEYNMRLFYNSAEAGTVDYGFGEEMWQWMLSTMLSLQFADALSRLRLDLDGVVWLSELELAWNFARSWDQNEWAITNNATPFGTPDAARTRPEHWTEMKWRTEQYVYSWSLRQTPSYVALRVLVVQSLIVMSHVVLVWWRNWRCHAGRDLLALVALAFQSPRTGALEGTSLGVRSRDALAASVRMLESEDGESVVLVVGKDACDKNGVERRLVAEKQYT